MFTHMKRLFLILALLAALLGGAVTYTPARAVGVLYAEPAATGSGDCSSWANACTLQTAITNSVSGDQIWVQQGIHKPHASDRTVSFTLKNGVEIYGGFNGTETALSERNPAVNVTILSGDLNGDDSGFTNNGENSYHVVVGSSTNSTAILDGFTITGGNANGSGWPHYNGGGMINWQGSPTLSNLTFTKNYAFNHAGGMMNDSNSNLNLTNSTFNGNESGNEGGGMSNWNASNLTLINVTFASNSSPNEGGELININSNLKLVNTTIAGNPGSSGDLRVDGGSNVTLINTIIANSTGVNCSGTLTASSSNNLIRDASSACGLTNGANGNIVGVDPKLDVLKNNGGFTQTMALKIGSRAIESGNDANCPANDQRGQTRPKGSHCDIGAFESPFFPGTLDPTFSGDGRVTTNLGSTDFVQALAIQTDGKIVAVGGSGSNFALVRYNTNGTLDTTFSGDGRLTTNFGGVDTAQDVAVQSDGKIVVVGDKCTGGICDLALARYNSNGTLDTTFSGDGKLVNNYREGHNGGNSFALLSNGKIMVAGYAPSLTDATRDFAIYRFNSNGTLDTTFSADHDGVAVGNFGLDKQDFIVGLKIQSDGKIILAGFTGEGECDLCGNNNDFAIARLKTDGTADITFSGDGKQTTDFGADDGVQGLALQSDGKIVAVGRKCTTTTCSVAMARYNTNGNLDTTFDGDGKKVFNFFSNLYSNGFDPIVTSNGRIVVMGTAKQSGGSEDYALARLLPSGAFDTSFSGDGKVRIDFGGADWGNALARQLDGKYVLGGIVFGDFGLARVLP